MHLSPGVLPFSSLIVRFVGTAREIFKWLPELKFDGLHKVFEDEMESGVLRHFTADVNKSFSTPVFSSDGVRMRFECCKTAQSLIMGKRVVDVGVQLGLSSVAKLRSGQWYTHSNSVFILERCTAVLLKKAETLFHKNFIDPLRSLKVVASDEKGSPVEHPTPVGVISTPSTAVFDYYDKSSSSHSVMVYTDVYRFYLFYCWQWAQWYAGNDTPQKAWSKKDRVRQSMFLISLLRFDLLAHEVLLTRPNPTDSTKVSKRADSFVPYIPSRLPGTLATSFDYLYQWIPAALGLEMSAAPSPCRSAVVHIARFFYTARLKA